MMLQRRHLEQSLSFRIFEISHLQNDRERFRHRKTSVEPLFDLIAKVIGATGKQKQLLIQRLVNVRTALALGALSVQFAMVMNSIWNLRPRDISTMSAAFS